MRTCLDPLTPQSDALTTRLLRPACCGQAFTVVLRHKSRHFRQSLVSIRRRVHSTLRRRVIVAHDVAAVVLRIRTIPVRSQSAIRQSFSIMRRFVYLLRGLLDYEVKLHLII